MCERNIHQLPLVCSPTGDPASNRRHMPRQRIEPVTFCFARWHPTNCATLVRVRMCTFSVLVRFSLSPCRKMPPTDSLNNSVSHFTYWVGLKVQLFFSIKSKTFFIFTSNYFLDILSMLAISHYWLLVSRGQGCCYTHLSMHKTAQQQRIFWPKCQ